MDRSRSPIFTRHSNQGWLVPARAGDGHGPGRGRSDRRDDLPDAGRDGEVAGLALVAHRRLADDGGQRDRRCALLRRAGGALPGGRRALRLSERSVRAADRLPLRLALDAGDRPGTDRDAGRRTGGLRGAPGTALRLGSEGGGRRGHRRPGRGQHGGQRDRIGGPPRPGRAEARPAGVPRGLGLRFRPRRLDEPHAVLDAAARLRPAPGGPGRRPDPGLHLVRGLVGRQQDRGRSPRPRAHHAARAGAGRVDRHDRVYRRQRGLPLPGRAGTDRDPGRTRRRSRPWPAGPSSGGPGRSSSRPSSSRRWPAAWPRCSWPAPRVYYAMARDGLFFSGFAAVRPTPGHARAGHRDPGRRSPRC